MRRYTVAIDGRTYTIDVAETAADAFEVTVDGRTYAATLTGDRDLPGVAISPEMVAPEARWSAPPTLAPAPSAATNPAPPLAPPQPAANRPTPVAAPRPVAAARRPVSGELVAPMPGVILEVDVAPGAEVRRGDPLLVIEAMKMRNTIRAPRDGIVAEIGVEAGAHVDTGQPMVRIADAVG